MAPRVSGSGQYAHRTKGRTARLCALIFALVTCTLATTGGFGGGSGHASNVVVESWHDRGHLPTSSGRDADALSRVSGDGPGGGDISGRRPLVAVYFTGQARTLNRTLCSIRRRIFEPLIFAGYTPVVFVAGERDDEASDYERYLGAIRDVELGDVSIVPRPHVSRDPSEVPVPYDRLPPPESDPQLPTPIPGACLREFGRKGRWFHGGGDGTKRGTKNAVYSEEVLSQLYYRAVVDRLRRRWEARRSATFEWIVVPRPDNVYIDDLPNLRGFDPEAERGTVWVPTWGTGHDPNAGKGLLGNTRVFAPGSASSRAKAREGVNNRFSFGGVDGMRAYHDAYARLCHDGLAAEMPSGVNLEQLVAWYLDHPSTRVAGFARRTLIPGEFWFLRLRRGEGTTPVEHPEHRPPMVPRDWNGGGPAVWEKRWEVWEEAARETWRCEGGDATDAGECRLRQSRASWEGTSWIRTILPVSSSARLMAFSGGWLEGAHRSKCARELARG